ncbi:hypothetical protein GCM10020254_15450 [Streptomyces goshikiensis]
MAARLWAESVVFAESMARCEAAFEGLVDWRLSDVIAQVPGAVSLEREDVAQPASFAVMVSLAELWRSLGVVPDAVVGAFAGGDRCGGGGGWSVVGGRGAGGGVPVAGGGGGFVGWGIASVRLSRAEVEERLAGGGGGLSVAVVNAPSSTVVAGELGRVGAVRCRV